MVGGSSTIRPSDFVANRGCGPFRSPSRADQSISLRPFLNVGSDVDFVLVVSWILAALCDKGPYPVLVLRGEQGSAKSSLCEIVRELIDPNTAPLRALPRDERDLFIAANKGHVQAFDNVSALQPWLSDALCRLATGGGFGTAGSVQIRMRSCSTARVQSS